MTLCSFRSVPICWFAWETGPANYSRIVSRQNGCETPNPASLPRVALPADLPGGPHVSAAHCIALNLKGDAIRSDTGLMKFTAHTAPARSATELRSVRRSLNTPVLDIAQLPVGPASAAIAAHVDSCDGLPRYTLAVRCERSRGVVFFTVRDEDLARTQSSLAAEAALSLAEGMGFLFDEDSHPVSDDAAASIWDEFVDAAGPGAAAAEVRSTPLLTKFRRPTSWSEAGSAAVVRSEAVSHGVASAVEAGLETSDTQIAQQGDR